MLGGVSKIMKKGILNRFTRTNKWIWRTFLFAVFIIVSYILSIDSPEWFYGAEVWFNLLFQFSIGYIINFMFYITQVYIPNTKRNDSANKCIKIRIEHIVGDMRQTITTLGQLYIKNHCGDNYTEVELDQLMNLKFSDKVQVINAGNNQYFTVRDWIKNCIYRTEKDIDKLYQYYTNDISADLMNVLENVLNSTYHSVMKTLLAVPNDVKFNDSKDNFFIKYNDLICELKQIVEYEYS